MAKVKTAYFCSSCGYEAPKWMGKCPACNQWNTFTQETVSTGAKGSGKGGLTSPVAAPPTPISQVRERNYTRMQTGCPELDRVLGGGLVPGSLVLLGGEPGIGKSTLSLQIALAEGGIKTLYVSGEESPEQIRMRAQRIGIHNEECYIYADTLLENILAQIEAIGPGLVIVDSIQTISSEALDPAAGSVSQIRECTA